MGTVCGTAAYEGLEEDSISLMAGIKRLVDLARLLIYVASDALSKCWPVHDRHAVIEEDKFHSPEPYVDLQRIPKNEQVIALTTGLICLAERHPQNVEL